MTFRYLVAAGLFTTLSGCVFTSSDYFYNSAADVSQAHRADYQCELAAVNAVPPSIRVTTTPIYTTPGTLQCYGAGYSPPCYTTGGLIYGGHTQTYDANESLRNEYYGNCMAQKGWSVLRLPNCDPSLVPADLKAKLMGKLRQPKEGACFLRLTERAGNIVYPSELAE